MKKKILVVDDSALMRRVMCDIINSDNRFEVVDTAQNGLEAFDLLISKTYDAVVLDINMPKMNGLQLLRKLMMFKVAVKVIVASTDTREGAKVTMEALECGAVDFIHIPDDVHGIGMNAFKKELLRILDVVMCSEPNVYDKEQAVTDKVETIGKIVDIAKKQSPKIATKKVIAIASSTGGPRALQAVISKLPQDLNAPVLIVQHMPQGFTASLAERLDSLSALTVKEAGEGEELRAGNVYLAMGGKHMKVYTSSVGKHTIHYTDEPTREGVKPCANYLYESLTDSRYDSIICVVMTGMGADGTAGIRQLRMKKKLHVIVQDRQTSTVYGMPKSVEEAGLADQIVPLEQIAQEIILNVGVK